MTIGGKMWTKEPWPDDGLMHAKGDLFRLPREGGVFECIANRSRATACVNGCAGLNPSAFRECVEAVRAQHRALDWCLARIAQLDEKFYPSESPAWSAVVQGNDALTHAHD